MATAHIPLPWPSFYPMLAALGMPVMGYAVVYRSWLVGLLGMVVCLAGFYGWVLELSHEPDAAT